MVGTTNNKQKIDYDIFIIETEEGHTFLVNTSTANIAKKLVKERGYTPMSWEHRVMMYNDASDIENFFG